MLSRPDAESISFMADDAFYYLVPAYSFAHGEGWTFDHLTRTSGFQLVYGYAAALVSLATGYSRAFRLAMTASSAIALLIGVWLMLKRSAALYGPAVACAAIALALASPRALFQITAGLEWGWVVMATALVVCASFSSLALGIATFLAVLTRVDLALFVAIYCVALAWAGWYNGRPLKDSIYLVIAAALGAIAAIGVTGVNSWTISGYWVPNSVATKAFWSRTNDFQPAISLGLVGGLHGTGPDSYLGPGHARSPIVSRHRRVFLRRACRCAGEWRKGAERFALVAASTVVIAAYATAYARGVNLIGDHYSASIMVPMMWLTCGLFAASRRYRYGSGLYNHHGLGR